MKKVYLVNSFGDIAGEFCDVLAFESEEKAKECFLRKVERAKEEHADYLGDDLEIMEGNGFVLFCWAVDTHYYHRIELKELEVID